MENKEQKSNIDQPVVIGSKYFLFKVYHTLENKLYFLLSNEPYKKGDWIFDTHSLGWDTANDNKKYDGIYKIISSTIPMRDKSLPIMEWMEA